MTNNMSRRLSHRDEKLNGETPATSHLLRIRGNDSFNIPNIEVPQAGGGGYA